MATMLTVKEAARELGVHEQTIRSWARKGILKALRLPGSGHRRFAVDEVQRAKRLMGRISAPVRFTHNSSLFGLVGIGQSGHGHISAHVDEELAKIYMPERTEA